MQLNLFGKIINGKLEFSNKEALKDWILDRKEGDDIVVKFNLSSSYKSARQIRLLYHCFRELSILTGYTIEEIKALMKFKHGICAIHKIEGEDISFCRSISDMTKREIGDFIQFIDLYSSKTFNHPLLNNDDIQFLKSI